MFYHQICSLPQSEFSKIQSDSLDLIGLVAQVESVNTRQKNTKVFPSANQDTLRNVRS